jgi:hypothetical protein
VIGAPRGRIFKAFQGGRQALPKLQGRHWYWIDDEVKYFEKEIEELNLPKER